MEGEWDGLGAQYYIVHLEAASSDEHRGAGIVTPDGAGISASDDLCVVVGGVCTWECGAFDGYIILGNGEFLLIHPGIHEDSVAIDGGIVCCRELKMRLG